MLIGRDHISGSPFAVVIKPADAKPLDSTLGGAGLTLATAGEVTSSSCSSLLSLCTVLAIRPNQVNGAQLTDGMLAREDADTRASLKTF